MTHKGTNQVKESKINMLTHNYKLFKMESTETIIKIFTHFIDIINGLKSLGRSYSNSDLVKKILRSLPSKKSMNNLPLEKPLGLLMTHELAMK